MTHICKWGGLLVALAVLFTVDATVARAENCVTGVRILAPWTAPITGNACDWPASAAKAGFLVDRKLANGAVLVYGSNYNGTIGVLGHVAVILGPAPGIVNGQFTIWICDSSPPFLPDWPNGWARRVRMVPVPDMTKCWVIHPK